jgi:extracellular factor (EF) 3-hydroxypalmitic acid methyl ester biosynthesis protein
MAMVTQPSLNKLSFLDEIFDQIQSGHVFAGLQSLKKNLNDLRLSLPVDEWKRVAKDCSTHPLAAFVHQSEMSRRAFQKPRGYAGDAALLDLIYGITKQSPQNCEVAELCKWEFELEACKSVRARKNILTKAIDERRGKELLSVACGHLGEARSSIAAQENLFQRFVALDQDTESLAVVTREFQPSGIETVQANIVDILKKKVSLDKFHFIYSAGLFDYLPDPLATSLASRLFEMLHPGGKLLVANFTPELEDIGYMEAFLQWFLIYRNELDMRRLMNGISVSETGETKLFRDPHRNVVFLEITRVLTSLL